MKFCCSCGMGHEDNATVCTGCNTPVNNSPQQQVDNFNQPPNTGLMPQQGFGHAPPPNLQGGFNPSFTQGAPPPVGVIGVRSSNLVVQVAMGWAGFAASLMLTFVFLWLFLDTFFAFGDIYLILFCLFLATDFLTLPLPIFFTVRLTQQPKTRIEYTGSEIIIHESRKIKTVISPNQIVSVEGKRGNAFFNTFWHLADGTVTINLSDRVIRLTFIRQSMNVAAQLNTIASCARGGY